MRRISIYVSAERGNMTLTFLNDTYKKRKDIIPLVD